MRAEELLKKYIASGLNDQERFELEKLALDDDFLADAWEGLSQSDVTNSKEILARLEQRLKTNKSTRVIPLHQRVWPYALAASFILLFAVTFLMNDGSQSKTLETSVAIQLDDDTASEIKEINEPATSEREINSNDNIAINKLAPNHNKTETEGKDPIAQSSVRQQDAQVIINSVPSSEVTIVEEESRETAPESTGLSKARELENTSVIEVDEKNEIEDLALVEPSNLRSQSTSLKDLQPSNTEPAAFAVQSSRSEKKNITQALSRKVDNAKEASDNITLEEVVLAQEEGATKNPQPVIGFQEYRKLLVKNSTISREELFMMNVKENFLVESRFTVNSKNEPNQIELLNFPDSTTKLKLIELLKKSGPWQNISEEWTNFSFRIPVKK